jgi:hypothetical protein
MDWIEGVYAFQNRSWGSFHRSFCALLNACIEQNGRFLVVNFSDSIRYLPFRSLPRGEVLGEAVSNGFPQK